ncbi:hypothetical protein GF371_01600 [Candidatus Woesearchaeota archaeon]|nr:hypothetical protein [Candidatus Woesearchaeota archaeon]
MKKSPLDRFFSNSLIPNISRLSCFFLLLFVELYFFKYIYKTNIIQTTDMSLSIADTLWREHHIFLYKVPFLLLIFGTIITYLVVRHKLNKLGKLEQWNWVKGILFFGINIILFVLFLILNFYIIENKGGSYSILLFLWYLLAVLLAASLSFVFFPPKTVLNVIRRFYLEIIISFVLAWLFLNFYSYFQKLWPFFSWIVGKTVYFFLSLLYSDAVYSPASISFGYLYEGIPTVGTSSFAGAIFKECSGIEGMSLFLLFFTIIVMLEWKTINKKKLLLLYPLGVGAMFLINILRVTSLMIAGTEISPAFAAGGFHSNFGWILFAIFFVIFEFFSYRWMKN